MNMKSRIAPILLSCEQIDGITVKTRYKAGYGDVIVESVFSDDNTALSDLLYEIILKNRANPTAFYMTD
jgi:hypothetical protein